MAQRTLRMVSEETFNTLKETIDAISTNVSTANSDIEDIKTDLSSVKAKSTSIEGKVDTLGTNLNTANTNLTSVKGTVESSNSKATSIEGKADSIISKVDAVSSNLNTLNTNLLSVKGTAESTNSKVTSIDGKSDSIITNLGTANDSLTNAHLKLNKILRAVGGEVAGKYIYGIHFDDNESNVSTKVTYLEDAKGKTPCQMNLTTGVFDYGSWNNAFFLPRPVMLRRNGTIAYELNANDYTLKSNGDASDIANLDFDGNAMMEWGTNGHIFWKIAPDDNNPYGGSFYVANHKVDETFNDFNYNPGCERFYTSIFQGCLDGNSRLRSISGTTLIRNKNSTEEESYARNNGTGYDIGTYSDWLLIGMLMIMMGKNTHTQSVYGQGHCNNGYTESLMLAPGTMNNKGLFWGESTGVNYGMKALGMEHVYGNQWMRLVGWFHDKTETKFKLSRGKKDGSTTDDYNTTGEGYITADSAPTVGSNGGYPVRMKFTPNGLVPTNMNGSASTYYPDGYWFNDVQLNQAIVGGGLDNGGRVGALCSVLDIAPGGRTWNIGCRLRASF